VNADGCRGSRGKPPDRAMPSRTNGTAPAPTVGGNVARHPRNASERRRVVILDGRERQRGSEALR